MNRPHNARQQHAPAVQHLASDNAFIVSNVRRFADLEVIAPSLGYQIVDAGPTSYRVNYTPIANHRVKLNIAGDEITSFMVSRNSVEQVVNAAPVLLEAAPVYGIQHTTPGQSGLAEKVDAMYNSLMRMSADEQKAAKEAKGAIVRAKAEPRVSHTKRCQFVVSNITAPHLLEVQAPSLEFKIMHDGKATCQVNFREDTQAVPVKVMYCGKLVSGGNFTLVPASNVDKKTERRAPVARRIRRGGHAETTGMRLVLSHIPARLVKLGTATSGMCLILAHVPAAARIVS
eukprot:249131_1